MCVSADAIFTKFEYVVSVCVETGGADLLAMVSAAGSAFSDMVAFTERPDVGLCMSTKVRVKRNHYTMESSHLSRRVNSRRIRKLAA